MSVPRVLAVVGLLVLGVVLLPLLASVLDGEGTENVILPLHVVVVAAVGAFVWRALPGPESAGATASTGRRMLVGAAVGVAAAVVGLLFFFLLLSGFDGA